MLKIDLNRVNERPGLLIVILISTGIPLSVLVVWQPVLALLLAALILVLLLFVIDMARSIVWLGAITCATAPLRALAIPIQLPLIGLLHVYKLSLFLLLGLLSFYIIFIKGGKFRVRISKLTKKIIAFFSIWLGWLVLSLVWSTDLTMGIRYVFTFLMMVLLVGILMFLVNGNENRLKIFLLFLGIVVIVVMLQGLTEQIFGWRVPQLELPDTTLEVDPFFSATIYSFFNQPNDFATFLTICLPFFVLPIFMGNHRWIKLAGIGLSLLCLFLIFFTVSRINLGVALAIVFISPVFAFLKRGGVNVILGEIGVLAVGMIIVTLVIPSLLGSLPKEAYEKIVGSSLEFTNFSQDTSTSRRIELIELGFRAVVDTRFIGLGAGGAQDYLRNAGAVVLNFHSWWLEVLAVNGIVIFILYIGFYFYLPLVLFRQSKRFRSSWLGYLGRACSLSMIGLIIGQNGPSSMIYFPAMWVLFGLAITTHNVMHIKTRQLTRGAPFGTA